MRLLTPLFLLLGLACTGAGTGGDIGDAAADGTAPDSECVRYYEALIACAEEAGLSDATDPEVECAGAEELDYTCMADHVTFGDCSDQNEYALTVNGVWDACPGF
jgi:hypothetical protein